MFIGPPLLIIFILFTYREEGSELKNLKQILDELDIFDYTLTDCLIMRRICEVVSTRAAYLSAAG